MTKFLHKPTGESVEEERWTWVAFYNDGTTLKQFDGNTGEFHQFKEIDQTKLSHFQMVARHTDNKFTLLFNSNEMKLIHFYKRYRLNVGTDAEQSLTLYVFGYEANNSKLLNVITPNDELVTTDDITKLAVA